MTTLAGGAPRASEPQERACRAEARLPGQCLACDDPAREGSQFCAACARSFEAENWHQRELLDAVGDAFAYAGWERRLSGVTRRDFTVPEIRSLARGLRADQRQRARG
jgi:hypothetical protein